MRSESILDRLRELLSTECMVPSCSEDPDPILVDGSWVLLCPEHHVDVAVEMAKRGTERTCDSCDDPAPEPVEIVGEPDERRFCSLSCAQHEAFQDGLGVVRLRYVDTERSRGER